MGSPLPPHSQIFKKFEKSTAVPDMAPEPLETVRHSHFKDDLTLGRYSLFCFSVILLCWLPSFVRLLADLTPKHFYHPFTTFLSARNLRIRIPEGYNFVGPSSSLLPHFLLVKTHKNSTESFAIPSSVLPLIIMSSSIRSFEIMLTVHCVFTHGWAGNSYLAVSTYAAMDHSRFLTVSLQKSQSV